MRFLFCIFLASSLILALAEPVDDSKDVKLTNEIVKSVKNQFFQVENVIEDANSLLDKLESKMMEWKTIKDRSLLAQEYIQKLNADKENLLSTDQIKAILANDTSVSLKPKLRYQVLDLFKEFIPVPVEISIQEEEEEEEPEEILIDISEHSLGIASIDLVQTSPTFDARRLFVAKDSIFKKLMNSFKSYISFLSPVYSIINMQLRTPLGDYVETYLSEYRNDRHGAFNVLQDSLSPGDCWACDFSNGQCQLSLDFSKAVAMKALEVEHSIKGKYSTAMRDFEIIGVTDKGYEQSLGDFTFTNKANSERFLVSDNHALKGLRLKVLSNHGEGLFTCIYRVRVLV